MKKARKVSGKSGKLRKPVFERFLPDQAKEYMRDTGLRHRTLDLLAAQLPERTDVLIGQSLGSVLALELAALLPTQREPQVLVTAGSPLRQTPFAKHLREFGIDTWAGRYRGIPWINIYDPGDIVPLGRGLNPGSVGALSQIKVNNPSSRAHSASGYLSHPALARAIVVELHPAVSG